jgi:hypothetical protein
VQGERFVQMEQMGFVPLGESEGVDALLEWMVVLAETVADIPTASLLRVVEAVAWTLWVEEAAMSDSTEQSVQDDSLNVEGSHSTLPKTTPC